MQKMKLIDNKTTSRDQFYLNNGLVNYHVDIGTLQNQLKVIVPRFVDRAFISDQYKRLAMAKMPYNASLSLEGIPELDVYTYSNIHDFNQEFLPVGTLRVLGDEAIFPGQYASMIVLRNIILSDTITYIGSYAFCIGRQCQIDIQRLKDCKIDPRFLYIKPSTVKNDNHKIICNKQQYNYFIHNRSFKYSNILVLNREN